MKNVRLYIIISFLTGAVVGAAVANVFSMGSFTNDLQYLFTDPLTSKTFVGMTCGLVVSAFILWGDYQNGKGF